MTRYTRTYTLAILVDIEPLVKCMRDDKTKLLFKSEEYWFQTYPFFIILVTNVVMQNNKAMSVILQYEDGGFMRIIVQYLFLGKYRADILEATLAKKWILPRLEASTEAAFRFIYLRMSMITSTTPHGNLLGEDQNKSLYEIGILPVVHEAYDPNCTVSFMLGIVDLLKKWKDRSDNKQICYYMLAEFSVAGLVDADVISAVIDFGLKYAKDQYDEVQLPRIVYRLLFLPPSDPRSQGPVPNDARFAAAIRSGLLQLVLSMLTKFRNNPDASESFDLIVKGASVVSTHPKTAKALVAVHSKVETAMKKQDALELNTSSAINMRIYRNIGFIIDPDFKPIQRTRDEADEPVKCFSCSKVLEQNDIKRCSKCRRAVYCSKGCQTAHWKDHKKECKKAYKGKMFGVEKKDQQIMEAQALNLQVSAGEIFVRKCDDLLMWSIINDVDILDCVCTINFVKAPPEFSVKSSADFLSTNNCGMRPGMRAHDSAKKTIVRNRAKGAVTGIIIAVPATGGRDGSLTVTLQDFPGEHLLCGSWHEAQRGVRNRMIQSHPGWRPGLPFPIG